MKCIVCGKESEYRVCGKCFAERNNLVILPRFELKFCNRCGSARIGNEWIKIELEEAIKRSVLKELRIFQDFKIESLEIFGNSVMVSGEIYGDKINVSVPLIFKVHRIACPRCSRESGGYYEAIVQVRAQNRKLREEEIKIVNRVVEELLERCTGERDFLLKVEEHSFGIDLYFGSRKIGEKVSKRIANELGGEISMSRKLHTRIDGRDVYRFTYLIRLPEAEDYDVVLKDEKICIVKNAKLQKGIEIISGKTMNIANSILIAKKDSMKWGVITSLDEHVAEVMDSNGKLLYVPRPYGAEIGKEVLIFEYKSKSYAFPKDV
ncbi:MAG: NMD3-related protein [Archaeoglobaceae archaeon]